MKFLYPGATDEPRFYGTITAPTHKNATPLIRAGKPWAADLGCLQGPDFVKKIDFNKVADWLPKMATYKTTCLFVAGGDIVGDAEGTLETFAEFSRYFGDFPLAYVAQNGAEYLPIPIDCAAVFIGGDTAWKESQAAVSVIKRAQSMGKHIHIGRVNSWRRYKLFSILKGSEHFTADGTTVRWKGVKNTLRIYEEWRRRNKKQPYLLQL